MVKGGVLIQGFFAYVALYVARAMYILVSCFAISG